MRANSSPSDLPEIEPRIHDKNQEFLGTKGLVFVGDKIVVYRRDERAPQHALEIDVPGGGREADGTPFETFQREVKEEFGLSVTPDDIFYSRVYRSTNDPTKIGYYLVAKLPAEEEKNIVFGDEGTEYFVITPEEFLNRSDAWPAYQSRARDYLESLKTE